MYTFVVVHAYHLYIFSISLISLSILHAIEYVFHFRNNVPYREG